MQDQGRALIEKVRHIELAYTKGKLTGIEDSLFDLAIGLAALNYGVKFGGDTEAFVETLIWHDARFGVGVWYLELMRELPSSFCPDDTDALLGIYIQSLWVVT
jgi:hypothetical protein